MLTDIVNTKKQLADLPPLIITHSLIAERTPKVAELKINNPATKKQWSPPVLWGWFIPHLLCVPPDLEIHKPRIIKSRALMKA